MEAIHNRFMVEGRYKYTYNNGNLAMSDPHAACMNFVNALEKLSDVISQHRERMEKKHVDVPALEAIVSRTWGKEDELKALKSELVALDRKITTDVCPKQVDLNFDCVEEHGKHLQFMVTQKGGINCWNVRFRV